MSASPGSKLARSFPLRAYWLTVPIALGLLSLLTVGYLTSFTPITIIDGDAVVRMRTRQTTVAGALREAGIPLAPEDIVRPAPDTALSYNDSVIIQRARTVQIAVDGEAPRWVRTQRARGSEVLSDLGYDLSVSDYIWVEGRTDDVLPSTSQLSSAQRRDLLSLPSLTDAVIHLRRAVPVTIQEIGGPPQTLKTAARTVGEALLQAGYLVYLADQVSPDLSTPIAPNMRIVLERAQPVTVWVDGRTLRTRTRQKTVADVLAEMNILLLDQDYTLPALDSPVLAGSEIRVVRRTRDLQVTHEYIPFETIWEADPNMELDAQALIQEGVRGIREKRHLLTLEDGLEVKRQLVADFTAQPPQPRIYKYGTKVLLRTLDTPQGQVQYWRKIRMLATSYSASTAGVPRSAPWYGRTRCGLPMGFGIVAVDPRVISLRTNVYVPGYGIGVACDTGGAIVGKRIDLGYDDNNLTLWYRWVDVYLLAPPPSQIRYRLE